MVGHPHGLAWFCSEHLEAAQALSSLTFQDAMKKLGQGC
jgi:hypothetical protein